MQFLFTKRLARRDAVSQFLQVIPGIKLRHQEFHCWRFAAWALHRYAKASSSFELYVGVRRSLLVYIAAYSDSGKPQAFASLSFCVWHSRGIC